MHIHDAEMGTTSSSSDFHPTSPITSGEGAFTSETITTPALLGIQLDSDHLLWGDLTPAGSVTKPCMCKWVIMVMLVHRLDQEAPPL